MWKLKQQPKLKLQLKRRKVKIKFLFLFLFSISVSAAAASKVFSYLLRCLQFQHRAGLAWPGTPQLSAVVIEGHTTPTLTFCMTILFLLSFYMFLLAPSQLVFFVFYNSSDL